MFDYFICYHLESGWHVTRPNQGLSLGRGKSLGTRLKLPKAGKTSGQHKANEVSDQHFTHFVRFVLSARFASLRPAVWKGSVETSGTQGTKKYAVN